MHKAFIGERDGRGVYLDPARWRQVMDDERDEAMAYADRSGDFDPHSQQGKKWLGQNAHKYAKACTVSIDVDELAEGPNLPHRDDKANSENVRATNRKQGQYATGIDAYLGDKYVPTQRGGEGKPDPIMAAAERDRLRGTRAKYGDTTAQAFIKENRTTTWGEQYVNAYGTTLLKRSLHSRLSYMRYWSDPTGNEALRNVTGNRGGEYVTVEMSRGLLKMWLRLHNILVERGRLTDKGRADAIARTIAGMESAYDVASVRVYRPADLWQFRHAPRRYHEGEFGEFLQFLYAGHQPRAKRR